MPYVRKTIDVWDIEQRTKQGWEVVTTETSRAEAKTNLRRYRENQPEYPARMRKRREPKPEPEPTKPKVLDLGIKFDIETKPGAYKLNRAYNFPTGRFTCVQADEKINAPFETTFVYRFRLSTKTEW